MVLMRWSIRGIGLVSTVVLARLLNPSDFGLVAIATMLFGFLLILGEFGFETVLIHKQDADRSYYDTSWTLTLIRGAVFGLALAALAPWAADFFSDARLQPIMYWLAASAFIDAWMNIAVVDFRKNMTFGRDFRFNMGPKIVGFAVTVPLAFLWRDYWALVAGILASNVARVIASYLMHPFRPRFSMARWHEIFSFSKWLLANNILGYVNMRSDEFVIGRFVGAQAVGLYSVAYEISNLPTSELVAPIRRAIFPGYAKLAQEKGLLRASFIDVWSLILMAAAPMAIGILLVGHLLVPVALGAKWIDAIPLINILAVYGLLAVIASNSGIVYIAMGKPRIITVLYAIVLTIKLPLLVWATITYGAMGAAWAATAGSAVMLILNTGIVIRLLELSPGRMVAASWRSVVATGIMAGSVRLLDYYWVLGEDMRLIALKLFGLIGLGIASYIVAHLFLWRVSGSPAGPESHVLTVFQKAMGKPSVQSL